MFRRSREMIIALRARRQSLVIARDVAWPPLELAPREPLIHLPPDFDKPPPRVVQQSSRSGVTDFLMSDPFLIGAMIAIAAGLVFLLKFG
jgi:hypothetical protein